MQVVRLPDWKLLVYLAIPFALLIGLFSTVQAVDPFRAMVHVEPGELRDTTFSHCWAGSTGITIGAVVLVLMVNTAISVECFDIITFLAVVGSVGTVRCDYGVLYP